MAAEKADQIVVFMTRSNPRCDDCGEELGRGAWIRKVEDKAQCLERAEEECSADAGQRAQRRRIAALRRGELDHEYIREFARHLAQRYPGCPPSEARRIADHACRKHSGRVGRSAAAKKFDPEAIDFATIARIRHAHTQYDDLLTQGWFRDEARNKVRDDIDKVLEEWSRQTR